MTPRLPISPASCGTRPPPEAFALDGPTRPLDRRTHAFRSDLADIELAGLRLAPHYARAETSRCILPSAMLRDAPSSAAPACSQIVHGETFLLLDRSGGWAWGRSGHDGYVGYVPEAALGIGDAPEWRVVVPRALAFTLPNIKSPAVAVLPIGSGLSGAETADGFVRTPLGFVHRRHVAPRGSLVADWVATAERLVGLPYLWGGRGGDGIDCSGLVQVALGLAGIAAPRDSDQQRDALGTPIGEQAPLRRGDLVFLPGHVGIMLDATRLLHANAWWMAVTAEPLADVVARAAPQGVIARRRIGE